MPTARVDHSSVGMGGGVVRVRTCAKTCATGGGGGLRMQGMKTSSSPIVCELRAESEDTLHRVSSWGKDSIGYTGQEPGSTTTSGNNQR